MHALHDKLVFDADDTAFLVGDYTITKAMKKMFWPWLQLSLAFATQVFLDLISISVIGRTENPIELAAVSLGNIVVIMFVMSCIQGMSTALETLVSQAYGASQPRLCGQHLNRMRLILFILFIPVCAILSQAERMLLFLGQDPVVSQQAAQFIIFQLPGLFMFSLFESNRLFLNSLEETKQATLILIIGIPLHLFVCQFFVFKLGFGVIGLSLAIDCTYTTFLTVLTLYCCFTSNQKIRSAWVAPDSEMLEGWSEMLELGIPGVLVYMIDFGSFEAIALFSGLIGIVELSTMGIILIVN